jgi:hypothetical protein
MLYKRIMIWFLGQFPKKWFLDMKIIYTVPPFVEMQASPDYQIIDLT